MKNKLVFRILGALASALIIASVFIPFVSVTGYSQSLWETHSAVGTIYLPIMIIVFGFIGVLVFSTGFKTELAYASAGGLLFFLIMQTIPIINQNLFNTLGVGYYCLVVGTFLIIIMAFICGLRVKQNAVENIVVEEKKEESMIDQIDRLYNDQTSSQNVNDNNSLDNIIQPLPISAVSQIPVENSIQPENNIVESVSISNEESVSKQNSNIVLEEQASNQELVSSEITNALSNINIENNIINEQTNVNTPNIQEQAINPVVSEFNIPVENVALNEPNINTPIIEDQSVNPVVLEFGTSVIQNQQNNNGVNPVIAEFNNSIPEESTFISNNNSTEAQVDNSSNNESINEVNTADMIRPLGSEAKIDVMAETTNNSSNLDIFG